MLPDKLAFVDLETTGTSAAYGRVIEIGIVRVEDNVITQTYHSLINPERHLPPEIEMLTGITARDLEGKPTFRQLKRDILEVLADCVFVAHNVRFDYSFLKHEFMRESIDFSSKHFCTVKLSRYLYPAASHHNLDAIIERFGFACKQRHRAFDDAEVLWKFYQMAKKAFPEEHFITAINQAMRRPTLPIKLTEEDLDKLPEQPGVYIFYGTLRSEGVEGKEASLVASASIPASSPVTVSPTVPLYVGKSVNIRDRVLSHFSGDLHSTTEMNIAQQIESIETFVTAGELGALFLEAKLIKQMLPIYNKMLRVKRELIALRKITDSQGYESVQLESLQRVDPTELESFLGFFRSKRQAKEYLAAVCKEYSLCEKLLGLEKTATACFAYRLGRCNGACTGAEKPLMYNLRSTTAFYKTKIKPWPFSKPIMIEETNELTGTTEYFIIDKWCYLGSVKTDTRGVENALLENDYVFDLDMYKILYRFLSKKENMKQVKLIEEEKLEYYNNSSSL
jgi:DNA polymerase-3 subunit epsilon